MALFIILVLAIIQGASEFMPISSSGHLVVFYNIFGVSQNTLMLSIYLHVATLLAVVIVYRKTFLQLLKKPFCKTNYLLLTTTIPTVIMVIIFEKVFVNSFTGNAVIGSFLVTALLLCISELIYKHQTKRHQSVSNFTQNPEFMTESGVLNFNIKYWQAFVIGIAQGVAGMPGISRSGATISAGLMVGVDKSQAANFSFLASVPIIIASLIYQVYKYIQSPEALGFSGLELFVGFVVCFIVGLVCLKLMINIVKKQKLYYFSLYLVLLSAFLLLNNYVLFWF